MDDCSHIKKRSFAVQEASRVKEGKIKQGTLVYVI